jgi:hypothetical protein
MKTSSWIDLNMRITRLIFLIFFCGTAFSQTLPQNAHKNPFGGGWECNRGFKQVGNECQKVQLPANVVLDILGHDWECARGFKNTGGQCIKVQIPANAGLDILGNDWECLRGYKRAGNECQKVQLPTNAVLDILGHDWECKRGFKRSGNECGKLTIPANASIDISGNDWTCNKGFKRSASECQQMTDSEKKSEADRDKALREEIKRRQARGARGNHCDSEYKSGANVCVTVRNAELDCSESYDGSSYDSCRVEVSLYVETDYRGRGYIDGRVKCEATVSAVGSRGYESTQTNDERWNFSLYANDSSTRSIDIDFSFSSYDKVRKVRISDLTCRVRDLYAY